MRGHRHGARSMALTAAIRFGHLPARPPQAGLTFHIQVNRLTPPLRPLVAETDPSPHALQLIAINCTRHGRLRPARDQLAPLPNYDFRLQRSYRNLALCLARFSACLAIRRGRREAASLNSTCRSTAPRAGCASTSPVSAKLTRPASKAASQRAESRRPL